MSFFKLKPEQTPTSATVTGRDYFESAAEELGLSNLDPVSIQHAGRSVNLKPGRRESRFGGRITRNLKHLSPEETADRRERSERFLKQPDLIFPAEEEHQEQDVRK